MATKKEIKSELNAMDVYAWVNRSPRLAKAGFTTKEVSEHFSIAPTRSAAFIAILRIKELIVRGQAVGGDGSSHWVVVAAG